jgi:Zn-dependent protease
MAAMADFSSPLLWAILIGWMLSVVLHEFAHGLVAHWGGDWTIRQRGGLSLNPLQYVDPMMSLAFPALVLVMGGVPLPGGATYVRDDLLRSRIWRSAVSAAGPAMNILLFLLLLLPFHPSIELIDAPMPGEDFSNAAVFLGAMGVLQIMAAILNLVPIPPLDGFGIIRPFLSPQLVERLLPPHVQMMLFWFFFMVLWAVPDVMTKVMELIFRVLLLLGFDHYTAVSFFSALGTALFGR